MPASGLDQHTPLPARNVFPRSLISVHFLYDGLDALESLVEGRHVFVRRLGYPGFDRRLPVNFRFQQSFFADLFPGQFRGGHAEDILHISLAFVPENELDLCSFVDNPRNQDSGRRVKIDAHGRIRSPENDSAPAIGRHVLKKRSGEVSDGRSAVHHTNLFNLDQFGGCKIAFRTVGQERGHPDQTARCASAPEHFLFVPKGKEKGRELSSAPAVERVHRIIGDQVFLTLYRLYNGADIRDEFRWNEFLSLTCHIASPPSTHAQKSDMPCTVQWCSPCHELALF